MSVVEGRHKKITSANAGKRLGLAAKSRVGLSFLPGVAEFSRWALDGAAVRQTSPVWA